MEITEVISLVLLYASMLYVIPVLHIIFSKKTNIKSKLYWLAPFLAAIIIAILIGVFELTFELQSNFLVSIINTIVEFVPILVWFVFIKKYYFKGKNV